MSEHLDKIEKLIELLTEARARYPYERTADGGFDPPVQRFPTWLWREIVYAPVNLRHYHADVARSQGREPDDFDDEPERADGEIDQWARLAQATTAIDETLDYHLDGLQFVPAELSIPTSGWHEVVMLLSIHLRQDAVIDRNRPAWINADGTPNRAWHPPKRTRPRRATPIPPAWQPD